MVKKSPATGKPMKPLEITIPAETQNETNPEVTTHETPSGETYTTPKLKVPEAKPQPPVERLTKEEAEKWAGVHYAERDPKQVEMFQSIRRMVDAIPTPTRDDGSVLGSFSAFALIKDVLHGSLNLMEAPEIGAVQPEWIMKNAMDMAPTSAVAGAATMPKGAFGMFGSRPGPQASPEIHQRYADLMKQAKRMDQDLLTPEEIHKQTGMSKDHSGQWVYEVPNDDVRIDVDKLSELNDIHEAIAAGDPSARGGVMMLDEVVDLPDVYAHWPELKETFVTVDNTTSHIASYNPVSKTITVNVNKMYDADAVDDADARTFVHEIQHALQWLQGRKGGSSPEKSDDWMKKSLEVMEKAARRALSSQGEFTPAQNNALMRIKRIKDAWKKMDEVWGEGRGGYKMDPGEIEAELSEGLVTSPHLIKQHPDSDTRRAISGVPAREFQGSPADMHFPAADPNDKLGITKGKMAGGKTFGKRGTEPQLSDKGDGPDFAGKGLPKKYEEMAQKRQKIINDSDERIRGIRDELEEIDDDMAYAKATNDDDRWNQLNNLKEQRMQRISVLEETIKVEEDILRGLLDNFGDDEPLRYLNVIREADIEHLTPTDKQSVMRWQENMNMNIEGLLGRQQKQAELKARLANARSTQEKKHLSNAIKKTEESIKRRLDLIHGEDDQIQKILDRNNQREPSAHDADARSGPPKGAEKDNSQFLPPDDIEDAGALLQDSRYRNQTPEQQRMTLENDIERVNQMIPGYEENVRFWQDMLEKADDTFKITDYLNLLEKEEQYLMDAHNYLRQRRAMIRYLDEQKGPPEGDPSN